MYLQESWKMLKYDLEIYNLVLTHNHIQQTLPMSQPNFFFLRTHSVAAPGFRFLFRRGGGGGKPGVRPQWGWGMMASQKGSLHLQAEKHRTGLHFPGWKAKKNKNNNNNNNNKMGGAIGVKRIIFGGSNAPCPLPIPGPATGHTINRLKLAANLWSQRTVVLQCTSEENVWSETLKESQVR